MQTKFLCLFIILFSVNEILAKSIMLCNNTPKYNYEISQELLNSSLDKNEKRCKKGKRLLITGAVFSTFSVGLFTYKHFHINNNSLTTNGNLFRNVLVYSFGGITSTIGISYLTIGGVKLGKCKENKRTQLKDKATE